MSIITHTLPPTEIAGEAPRGSAALTTFPVSHVELPTKLLIRDTAELSLLQRKPGLRDSCEMRNADSVAGGVPSKRRGSPSVRLRERPALSHSVAQEGT